MHILKRMRLDKETGKKTLLRCLNSSYSRHIQSQLNLTAVKSDLVAGILLQTRASPSLKYRPDSSSAPPLAPEITLAQSSPI